MARTKQTARMSTGGSAPRRTLLPVRVLAVKSMHDGKFYMQRVTCDGGVLRLLEEGQSVFETFVEDSAAPQRRLLVKMKGERYIIKDYDYPTQLLRAGRSPDSEEHVDGDHQMFDETMLTEMLDECDRDDAADMQL